MKIEVDLRRPRWLRKPATWKARIALMGVALLTVAVPVAWASHDFTDVPTAHPFHSQISAIKTAGITQGCTPTTYCPNDPVTRGQMAAFFQRGLGRVARDENAGVTLVAGMTNVVTTQLTVPGSGFVLVNGVIRMDASGCPCENRFDLRRIGGDASFLYRSHLDSSGGTQSSGITFVFAVGAGTHTFALEAQKISGSGGMTADAGITALWVPFGSTGGSTLGESTSATQSDSR